MTLVVGAIILLLTLLPDLLIQMGASLMERSREPEVLNLRTNRPYRPIEDLDLYRRGQTISWIGWLLSLAALFVETILQFPINYYFLLHPDRPVKEALIEGAKLGARRWTDILVFQCWLWVPVFIGIALFLFTVRISIMIVIPATAAGLAALIWYTPYIHLSLAMFGKALIGVKNGSFRPRRRKSG